MFSRYLFPIALVVQRSLQREVSQWHQQRTDFQVQGLPDTDIPACEPLNITWNVDSSAQSSSAGPYSLVLYQPGYEPIKMSLGPGPHMSWTAPKVGQGPYLVEMKDSQGNTGGVSNIFDIITENETCASGVIARPNSLQYNRSEDTTSQCGTHTLNILNGVAPFQLTILPEHYPPQYMNSSVPLMNYTVDLPAGTKYFLVVSDSSGLVSVDGVHIARGPCTTTAIHHVRDTEMHTTNSIDVATAGSALLSTPSANPSLQPEPEGATGRSQTPVIVGASLGSVTFCLLLWIAAFPLRRRRHHVREEEQSKISKRESRLRFELDAEEQEVGAGQEWICISHPLLPSDSAVDLNSPDAEKPEGSPDMNRSGRRSTLHSLLEVIEEDATSNEKAQSVRSVSSEVDRGSHSSSSATEVGVSSLTAEGVPDSTTSCSRSQTRSDGQDTAQ